jgi:hypothetical protein
MESLEEEDHTYFKKLNRNVIPKYIIKDLYYDIIIFFSSTDDIYLYIQISKTAIHVLYRLTILFYDDIISNMKSQDEFGIAEFIFNSDGYTKLFPKSPDDYNNIRAAIEASNEGEPWKNPGLLLSKIEKISKLAYIPAKGITCMLIYLIYNICKISFKLTNHAKLKKLNIRILFRAIAIVVPEGMFKMPIKRILHRWAHNYEMENYH